MTGDEALAHGALTAGVQVVTGYPGSPSSGTMDALIESSRSHDLYIEWSSNERVALEMAIGASIAGQRALVCTKSVGMNVMLDPLMALNLTPLRAGLVILLGDDPGGYGSQNDQDTRPLAAMTELPMLEPRTPAEATAMMRLGFTLSEKHQMPIIIRETRGFSMQVETVTLSSAASGITPPKEVNEPLRFVPVPSNVVRKHRDLHRRLSKIGTWLRNSEFNQVRTGGKDGIIAAGFVTQKLLDVIGKEAPFSLLKLGVLYPLPEQTVIDFLAGCDSVLILEETGPFVELGVKAMAQTHHVETVIFGKQSGHVPREGELFRWQIQSAVSQLFPYFTPVSNYLKKDEAEEYPQKKSYCGDCRYDEIIDLLNEAACQNGQDLALVGDPGCLVTVAHRLHAKYAIGSAIAVADGMAKAGMQQKPVALVGDSGFFHSTLPALCNAVHNKSNILIVVLNNGSALTSGRQPHAGTAHDALGGPAQALSIARICRACGIAYVRSLALADPHGKSVAVTRNALTQKSLSVLIMDIPPQTG